MLRRGLQPRQIGSMYEKCALLPHLTIKREFIKMYFSDVVNSLLKFNFFLSFSLPSKTGFGTEVRHFPRGSTGWTGLKRSTT